MLFHSHEYVFLFLPLVVIVYYWLGRTMASKVWLLLASLLFYSWWNPIFTPLLLASILANYTIGMQLDRRPSRALLLLGVCANLALLGYFKYANFFLEVLSDISTTRQHVLHVALPLAISFYTFQQIAFLVDAHSQKITQKSLLDYALFATFFPHLIAGPILHHKPMISQFSATKSKLVNYETIARGIFVFIIGLFKVLVIAEPLSGIVNQGYGDISKLSALDAWVVAISFMLQLYFDFSGYSDMAIGSALMLGIIVPDNFNSPYQARSIIKFWQTWHITLGRYFRDYFLVPLSGKKPAAWRRNLMLFLTFFLIGLWHGASWTFLVFGICNGLAILIARQWGKTGINMPAIVGWSLTMAFILFIEILFRAPDLKTAVQLLHALLQWQHEGAFRLSIPHIDVMPGMTAISALWMLPIGLVICASPINSNHLRERFRSNRLYLGASIFLFLLSILKMSGATTFIYFQF